MKPLEKSQAGRLGEDSGGKLAVDLALHADVRPGFELEISPLPVRGDVVGQGALDIAGRGVVPFDQVGIVAVHKPHQFGQAGSGAGMQATGQTAGGGGHVGGQIQDFRGELLRQEWFHAIDAFHDGCLADLSYCLTVYNIVKK